MPALPSPVSTMHVYVYVYVCVRVCMCMCIVYVYGQVYMASCTCVCVRVCVSLLSSLDSYLPCFAAPSVHGLYSTTQPGPPENSLDILPPPKIISTLLSSCLISQQLLQMSVANSGISAYRPQQIDDACAEARAGEEGAAHPDGRNGPKPRPKNRAVER